MSLPLYTESEACHLRRDAVDGLSCYGCRASVYKRISLTNAYTLPNDDVNFECPHGVSWVVKPKRVGSGRFPSKPHRIQHTPQEAKSNRRTSKVARAARERAILDNLTDDQRALVESRASICRSCTECCRGVFADVAKCRKAGCAGIKLSVEGHACPVGKW